MESAFEHDQPTNNSSSSSGSGSSNNSSSSNLLVNLPMLPLLHDDRDEDEDEDVDGDGDVQLLLRRQSLPMQPPAGDSVMAEQHVAGGGGGGSGSGSGSGGSAGGQPESLATQQAAAAAAAVTVTAAPLVDNASVFASPFLFNNNAIPATPSSTLTSSSSSSSTSTSSSSSHNLHQHRYYQQHTATTPPTTEHDPNQEHAHLGLGLALELELELDHHHQHAPSPSSNQQVQHHHFPSPTPSPYPQELERRAASSTTDPPIEADIADADADTDADNIINPNAGNSSDSARQSHQQTQHEQQEELAGQTGAQASAAAAGVAPDLDLDAPPLQLPPTALPLSVLEAAKETTPPHAAHYSHYTHPSPQYTSAHAHHNHHPCLGNNVGVGVGGNMFTSSLGYDNHGDGNGNGDGPQTSGHHARPPHHQPAAVDRIKMLYPNVNESETPLPRCWSPHDKCLTIGLSQNNLRVQYKGVGKQHNDAASVRTAHPIPPACGIYYFEVKIISKGKNGYMGIGLTAQQFRMNRLPGWDKHSYGYHGDDGNSFSSSGSGQSYGPTFTTGDVIGCCVNFVENTCFYTKNGVDLGIAFRDLPINTKLFPTVGLQTPGEEVDANFGQEPFKFDQIEDMMRQMRTQTKAAIYDYPLPLEQGDPTTLLHKMVSSYLVHNGYSETAEAFARTTSQTFPEDIQSVRNRQKILKLIMTGRMGQAIDHTLRSYPGLLENNKNLMFMLKCRQFIEMINGSDIETSVIQSTRSYQNGKGTPAGAATGASPTPRHPAQNIEVTTTNITVISTDDHDHQQNLKKSKTIRDSDDYDCKPKIKNNDLHAPNIDYINDVEMENNGNGLNLNGNSCKNGSANIFNKSLDMDEEMDVDVSPSTSAAKQCNGIERILEFGKELSQMGQQLEKDNKMNDEDRQMLEDAFSLIAYSNPWSSPLGWQLCPTKRETVCSSLNSAILDSLNFPRRPPLDYCVAHASELLKLMAQSSLGSCAFINIEDIFPQN